MRRSRCKRNQMGGGLGGIIEYRADPYLHTIQNGAAWARGGSCLAETRPGFLEQGVAARGLPGMGMGGGARKGSKSKSKGSKGRKATRKLRKQAGGRYGFDGSAVDSLGGGAPWSGSYAPVAHVPCEASRTPIPAGGASDSLNSRSSYLWSGPQLAKGQMGGGALTGAPITWPNHGAASGSPSEMVPTARFTQNAEAPIVSAAGTNIMVNTPLNYPQMNPACLKTGGARTLKSGRKNRKNRKGSRGRKNRKGSNGRKNRTSRR